ncbi:hypothetical protein NDU88_009086 [Pleurodeles waltl]|uniref:Secreted protein n=1 Tax=Pleurodeles waltl TaxID=8319 RepID=A0AAV7QWF3_PLEWA|nr:hypothetical protein NDU88_009086 [Pleurodeles waltl]
MSRVCAWIFLLVFRLRVVLRGCASKFRSHGRRRVDFSWGVGRRCPCEAVRQSFDLTAGVASISPGKSAPLSLRGRASKFRPHGRRRVDFSREVGRRCPCEAVRQSFGRPEGVASISVGVRRFSCRGTSCESKISAHGASKWKREVFLVLRLPGTGGKLYPSPWRALLQPDKSSARQQANSKAAVLCRKADR